MGCTFSFSGGKDSTVLLHIVRKLYPDVKAVFANTGLEFPEIVKFVKTFSNVDIVRPKMTFTEVIKKYGYPMISKEVSECVFGARKYLTQVLAENSLATDRQTDRQTDIPYAYRFKRLCGLDEYKKYYGGDLRTSTEDSEESETTLPIRIRKTLQNWEIWTAIKRAEATQFGQGGSAGNSQNLQESALLRTMLTQDCGVITDNLRVQRLMGINSLQGVEHPMTKETISSVPNRSQFSCERYQFFLDAPFEIGQQCCRIMKKKPTEAYWKKTGRVPITAQMASESRLRTQVWLRQGCNAFDAKKPISSPMAFWKESDCLLYIRQYHDEMIEWRREEFKASHGCYPEDCETPFEITSPIASVYGDIVTDDEEAGQMNFADLGLFELERPNLHTTGCNRTGCIACLYGAHHETCKEKSRIQEIIDLSNPKIADWMLRGGKFDERGLWIPYQGLGMWFPLLWANKYGGLHYWFPNQEYYVNKYSTEETDRWLKIT